MLALLLFLSSLQNSVFCQEIVFFSSACCMPESARCPWTCIFDTEVLLSARDSTLLLSLTHPTARSAPITSFLESFWVSREIKHGQHLLLPEQFQKAFSLALLMLLLKVGKGAWEFLLTAYKCSIWKFILCLHGSYTQLMLFSSWNVHLEHCVYIWI